MNRLYAVAAFAATLVGGTMNVATAETTPKAGIKNVVLVHGAFADGSGWEAVADILTKDGYTVAVVQHPETSYAEDIKFTKAVIDQQSGPVVLVGHSYGGAVITEAGTDPNVAALVYIAAFALDTGESCATIEKGVPPATQGIKPTKDGYFYIDPDRSINPEKERMMAKRANAKTIEVKGASHVVYISHPKETAKLIEEAATSALPNQ